MSTVTPFFAMRPLAFALALVALAFVNAGRAAAEDQEMLLDDRRAFIDGYDLVSYYQPGGPVRGQSKFRVSHENGYYWFASSENALKFASNPATYLPQYDGFCSVGVSVGNLSPVDPLAYDFRDGKLYFMINQATLAIWRKRGASVVARADDAWRRLLARSAGG